MSKAAARIHSTNQDFLKELEKVFKIFNKHVFGNKLKFPKHILQPDKKVVFRFVPESYSFLIGSKFSTLKHCNLLSEYLHEMVHIENYRLGIIDLTSNQYHNKQFLKTALGVGFYVSKHKNQGWAVTQFKKGLDFEKPVPLIEKKLTSCLKQIDIDLNSIDLGQLEVLRISTLQPAKICFLKYVCKCAPPHNSIRSGRRPDGPNPLNILCKECGSGFVLEDAKLESHSNED